MVIFPSFKTFFTLKRSPLKFSKEFLCLLLALLVVVRVRELRPELRDVLDLAPEELLFSLGAFGGLGGLGLEEVVVVLDDGRGDFPLLYAGADVVVVVLASPRTTNGWRAFDLGATAVVVLPELARPL